MSDEKQLPQAWIECVASVISDFHRADILHKLDDMDDEEIDAALE